MPVGSLESVSAPRLLFVQHADDCPPGWFGEWVARAGLDYEVVHGVRGDEVPIDLDGYAGLVVLGGDMGANDDAAHPWLTPTKALIASAVRRNQWFFGICLGHQLAAAALGGRVVRNPHGQATGLTPVVLTAAGRTDSLLGGIPEGARSVQWNSDVVSVVPKEATVLATAPDGTAQAIRYGERAWGVQFHPEASPAIFNSWTFDQRSADVRPGFDLSTLALEVAAAEPQLRATWEPLVSRFASFVRRAAEDRCRGLRGSPQELVSPVRVAS